MKKALEMMDLTAAHMHAAHSRYHMALRMHFAETLDAGSAHTQVARSRFSRGVSGIRTLHMEQIAPADHQPLADAVYDMIEQAQIDSGLPIPTERLIHLLEIVGPAMDTTTKFMRDTLHLDETVILGAFSRLQLQAALHAAKGVTASVAMNMVKAGALTNLHFGRTDRSGKKWDTAVYTRTLVRHLLVTVYCEAYLVSLLSNGVPKAWLTDDKGERMEFEILAAGGQLWEQLSKEYMHPNTEQLVSHGV
jgi:hypothetical protein